MAKRRTTIPAQNGTDIKVDFNRITRLQFHEFRDRLAVSKDSKETERISGELVEQVVVEWPFEQKISTDGYLALGMLDAEQVDQAVEAAMSVFTKKK